MTAPAPRLEVFLAERDRLRALAYRMLGSLAEAEDVVQDAWLRWAATTAVVERPPAYLTTVVTRLAVDRLTSVRAQREAYLGPWLPEPLLGADPALGPDETAEQREGVRLAVLALLERLAPRERAAYVLAEAFGYRGDELAEVLGTTPAAARQVLARARRAMAAPEPRQLPEPSRVEQVVEAFLHAAATGDLAGLERSLAADAVLVTDGGGEVVAARRTVTGREVVARFLARVARRRSSRGLRLAGAVVNGAPGFVVRDADGAVRQVAAVEAGGDGVRRLHVVLAPSKLTHLTGAAHD